MRHSFLVVTSLVLATTACATEVADDPAEAAEARRRDGERLLDPADRGVVSLGHHDEWNLAVDKASGNLLASCDDDTRAFSPLQVAAAPGRDSVLASRLPNQTSGSWAGVLCRAACWTAAGAGCAAVSVSCAIGTTVTVGGFAIPCAVVIIAACGAAGGAASVCSDWCTQQYGQ